MLRASNTGTPVTFDTESPAGRAYHDAVARFLGETREMRFVKPERRNFLPRVVRQSMMNLFKSLFSPHRNSASVAKERLKIVLAHERAGRDAPDFLPKLQKELIDVVGRYVEIRDDMIRVNLGKNLGKAGDTSLLEINIEIDGAKRRSISGIAGSASIGGAKA